MDKNIYSTFQAAKICHVSFMSINKWIESGEIKSFKTPGGHRRILRKDLLAFIKKHNFPLYNLPDVPLKILIVDDEEEQIELIAELLWKYSNKFEIESAKDGFDAGTKVNQFSPDVIILDLIMPQLSGFEVCRSIKTNHVTKHIKIIVLTGYGSDENVEKALDCGADRVLFKPLTFEVLIKEFKKVTQEIIPVEL